jgi:RNA polymerase sigma-70 factor (ECF subfamily)
VAVIVPDPARLLAAEEQRLLQQAQEGDRAAFATLVQRYWDRLYRWLYNMCHDRHSAEDLAQETFLKAFAHIARFRPGTNFAAWLFRIAHNNFANLYRSQTRQRGRQREALTEDVPAPDSNPLEEALSRESVQELGRAIAELPSDYRSALLLRVEEGMSFRQIAEVLELTEETARWRVFKARKQLLGQLSPQPYRSASQEKS